MDNATLTAPTPLIDLPRWPVWLVSVVASLIAAVVAELCGLTARGVGVSRHRGDLPGGWPAMARLRQSRGAHLRPAGKRGRHDVGGPVRLGRRVAAAARCVPNRGSAES